MIRTPVFEEVRRMVGTGIFFPSYTHVSSDINRAGIGKTGKIMSLSVALANDVVPFSGESTAWNDVNAYTFLLRCFYVSVSRYPDSSEQGWKNYMSYGSSVWTQRGSDHMIAQMRKTVANYEKLPYLLRDFENNGLRKEKIADIEQCIAFEQERQKRYNMLGSHEKRMLLRPKPEVYTFGSNLEDLTTMKKAMRRIRDGHFSHPIVPAEIKLDRYLSGVFTGNDIDETKQWIEKIVGREIPVASLDSFFLWDSIMPRLPSYREIQNPVNPVGYMARVNENGRFKAQVIQEVQHLNVSALRGN